MVLTTASIQAQKKLQSRKIQTATQQNLFQSEKGKKAPLQGIYE